MDEFGIQGRLLGDRYEIGERLGGGRLGTVHLAVDRKEDRKVVVKVPHPDLLSDSGFRRRFVEGTSVLVGHPHPSVVSVLDTGSFTVEEGEVATEIPYVVVEHMEGGSLEDRLGEGVMPVSGVASWLESVAGALDGLHADGVLHRDVKPENVLFDAEGRPKLSDIAITRALPTEPGSTPPGGADDTYGYAPPEALGGEIGPALDQYSLAAVVFRCVGGRRLYPHDPYLGVWKFLSTFVPGEVATAIEKALSVEPASRFGSCTEFAKAFGEASESDEGALGEAEATLAWSPSQIPGDAPAEEPPEAPEKSGPGVKVLVGVAGAAVLAVVAFLVLRGGGDGDAPAPTTLQLLSPGPETLTAEKEITVRGLLEGGGAAILVNDARVQPGDDGGFEARVELEEGANSIRVRWVAADGTKGPPTTLVVTRDTTPPAITVTEPENGHITTDDWIELKGRVADVHLDGVVVNGERLATSEDGSFSITLSLVDGANPVTIDATDLAGNSAASVALSITRDDDAPTMLLDVPELSGLAGGGVVEVKGRLDEALLARLTVNGQEVKVSGDGTFTATVGLEAGENTITVKAEDAAGNVATATKRVILDVSVPTLVLTKPADGSRTSEPTVVVGGRVEDERPASVLVGGKETPVKLGVFSVRFTLAEGENTIEVVPVDAAGNRGEAGRVRVFLDTTAPEARVATAPELTTGDRTTVSGQLSEDGCKVTVQGVAAPVEGRTFTAEVAIEPGVTDIEVVATDPLGNSASARAQVQRLSEGDVVLGGRAFVTRSGDRLSVGSGGKIEVGTRGEEAETFALVQGAVEATIASGTVLELPFGTLTVPAGRRAVLRAESLGERAARVTLTEGRVLLTDGDRTSVSLAAGQDLTLRGYEGEDYGISFEVAEASRGKIYAFVSLTPDLRAQLLLEGGARGALQRSGLATRVVSDPNAPAEVAFRVCAIFQMVAGPWTDVAPGATVRILHDSARIESE